MSNDSSPNTMGNTKSRPSLLLLSWKVNLLMFGLLTAVVISCYFWWLNRVAASFRDQAAVSSQIVATIIEESLRNSIMTGQVIDRTIRLFLHNSGEFIHYLEATEPFSSEGLTSYAEKAGLAGIAVVRRKSVVMGPKEWLSRVPDCPQQFAILSHIVESGQVFLSYPIDVPDQDHSCLIVGFDTQQVRALKQKTELSSVLAALSSQPGISYIRIEENKSVLSPIVQLVNHGNVRVAETSLMTSAGLLVVGLDGDQYQMRVTELGKQFFLFAALLLVIGMGTSLLLYRYQRADIQRSKDFEGLMTKQHEEAVMGKVAATVVHEIQNPLNAIRTGLQQLVMESYNLSGEQEQLLYSMKEAVKRTENVITRLDGFTRVQQLSVKPVRFDRLIDQTLTVYEGLCKQQEIAVKSHVDLKFPVVGDKELLSELLDTLIKISIEAQPSGGFISVILRCHKDMAQLIFSNGGFSLADDLIPRAGTPYFMTKTRETSLGLPLCCQIVEAHSGSLNIQVNQEQKEISIEVRLPLYQDKMLE